ncbi:hypothetical protein F383_36910 [Gossypium arboreum]|uniref:Uncharacterized protein n=1 Tax=Gossypium arboreum TaxID=29729 RepID=A0A0B0N9V2_GOSAR|nr:hypothetical protein F383_36910 [Gossypium arboreum]
MLIEGTIHPSFYFLYISRCDISKASLKFSDVLSFIIWLCYQIKGRWQNNIVAVAEASRYLPNFPD